MSYILDALKKSEQERSRGTVPDIKTVHQPGATVSSRPSSRPYIILMVLVFIAAGLAYWIFNKNGHLEVTSQNLSNGEPAASPSSDADTLTSGTLQQDTSDNGVQSPSSNQIQLAQNLTALREKAAEDADLNHPEPAAPVSHTKASVAAKIKKSEKPVHITPKRSKPNVVFSDEPLTSTYDEAANQATATEPSAPTNSTDAEDDTIYDIAELPDDVKRNLPAITFAGHVYSSSKSQRSVMLNGKKMREGEEVSKGLVLDQITMDGVVLRAEGYRFKLGALQDWSFQ